MKRLMAVVLSILLLLGIVTVNADEFRFRGIPWGTSASEIEAMDFPAFGSFFDDTMPYEENMLIDPSLRTAFAGTDNIAGYKRRAFISGDQLKVAGYNVDEIFFCCRYAIKDGVLDKDISHSLLYAADYVFDVVDYQTAYETLKSKLIDLYGPCEEQEEPVEGTFYTGGDKVPYIGSVGVAQWHGDNNTHIILCGQWICDEDKIAETVSSSVRSMSKTLFITYYQGGNDDILQEISRAEAQLEREEEAQDAEGYDGL